MSLRRCTHSISRVVGFALTAILPALAALSALPRATLAASNSVVISQVYGGGGNSGATLKNDFIELFNRGDVAVDLTGWTVQYASAAGSGWSTTTLSGSIPAGGYYLIQEAQGAGGSVNLPTPDATGTIVMSATAAKVALVSATAALSGTCPSGGIVDMIGYGAASCSEGSPAPTLSNTSAAIRKSSGCEETDNNAADFAESAPTPRNSASPSHSCQYTLDLAVTPPGGGTVDKAPDQATYLHGSNVLVTATPATGYNFVSWSGDATGSVNPLSVLMDAPKSITATFALNPFTLTVNVTGNGVVTRDPDQPVYDSGSIVQLTATADPGWHFVGWSGDASGSANPLSVTMDASKTIGATFVANTAGGLVVVSQVYGGGGNAGATLKHDFIELFNRGDVPVDISGWTVQYATASGTTWSTTALSGTLPAGGYYLVQEAQGAGGTDELPTPDATGAIAINASDGKVALVNTTAALTGDCPSGGGIVDLVGYGTATCSEGTAAAALDNTTAALRKSGGCADTDDNAANFAPGGPTPRNSGSPVHSCHFTLSVTVDPPDGGTVARSPDQATYAFGTPVQLTATRADPYRFAGWTGDATGSVSPVTVVMDGDKTVVAHFVPHTLTDLIVISQVYGGGGNDGAIYKNDYVELYNAGNTTTDVTGWTVQYSAVGSDTWLTTTLVGSIPPGHYFLVALALGANGSLTLPVPDAIGTIEVNATGGKVALVRNNIVLTGNCPTSPDIVDLVGYGAAECAEGVAMAALDNQSAAFRNHAGCDDSGNNLIDLAAATPGPRNSASPPSYCSYWLATGEVPITEFALAPVAPNPSSGPLSLDFALPQETAIQLHVLDVQGRLVAVLADGVYPAGRHHVTWNGARSSGRTSPGIYFIRLETPGRHFMQRVAVIR